jgi:hypothetical protein
MAHHNRRTMSQPATATPPVDKQADDEAASWALGRDEDDGPPAQISTAGATADPGERLVSSAERLRHKTYVAP